MPKDEMSVETIATMLEAAGVPLEGLDKGWLRDTTIDAEAMIRELRRSPGFLDATPAFSSWSELSWRKRDEQP